jgi:predicted permease
MRRSGNTAPRPAGQIGDLLPDIVYAFRLFLRSPGFSIAVVLSLSLGIGANTAIFSLINAVMLRNLPVKDPQSLFLLLRSRNGAAETGFTHAQYRLFSENNAADVSAYSAASLNVTTNDSLEPPSDGQLISGNYFSMLGISPAAGRLIGAEDDRVPNGHPVVVISYSYWQRRFGLSPATIGKTISISGRSFTIIGVTPPKFFGVDVGTNPDLYVPVMMQPAVLPVLQDLITGANNRYWLQLLVRPRPGVTVSQALATLDNLYQEDHNQKPEFIRNLSAETGKVTLTLNSVATGVSQLRQQFSRGLLVVMAIVGAVLLIACANTANLLLARAATRKPEFAMRLALGSSRWRLLRQLLVESVTLAGLAGLCGLLFSRWATYLLVFYISVGRTPVALDLAPDARVLAFTATISLLTGILFGIGPALRATRIDLSPVLRNLSRSSHTRRGLLPQKILAIVQIALSMLLLITAGVFVRSLQSLTAQNERFLLDSVLVARIEPKGSNQRNNSAVAARLDRLYSDLVERVKQIPGVRAASLGNVAPTKPDSGASGMARLPSGETTKLSMQVVYPGYFASLGIPLLRGRDFNGAEVAPNGPPVCIVNDTFARLIYPTEDPIGKPCTNFRPQPHPPEIVGVVKDTKYTNLKGPTEPAIYQPFLQASTGRGQMILYVRIDHNPAAVLPRVREEVWKVDKDVPQFQIHTLGQEVDAVLIQERLIATLSSLFSVLAMLLASVGLYGLLAFVFLQRSSEIGIRMALGAKRSDVISMVVREALTMVLTGVAIGMPLAFAAGTAASRRLSGMIFGIKPTDPYLILSMALVLVAVGAIAAYLPAKRASRVDPLVALRNE